MAQAKSSPTTQKVVRLAHKDLKKSRIKNLTTDYTKPLAESRLSETDFTDFDRRKEAQNI